MMQGMILSIVRRVYRYVLLGNYMSMKENGGNLKLTSSLRTIQNSVDKFGLALRHVYQLRVLGEDGFGQRSNHVSRTFYVNR